ncbi:hypothetical protein AXG93_3612s1000 [Marchantia polymorpha subsp. ruderalis]|uniref:C-terminal of Roc (COR) domain-containing protein n=1 Tax=Marchantia polymorpha subsp. ruderalis TaxID=1480154 RepID=A0A176WB59_MARPO|nr:hypothetical protein AXG93_3612s1000 [Marchantia polymorpha subsp. ruderalis]
MEGAVASIVSHAAETRGMDSADQGPELPSAVQDLIRRLEGKGNPITLLSDLRGREFQDFFPTSVSLSKITGWRSQVRLRVLESIGSCNTLEYLNVEDICGKNISRLSASEWELVLRAFRSSTILKEIVVGALEWSSNEEVERLCLQIGRILNTSSVQLLKIECTKLSARCFLNLASGLRGNPDSKLQSLYLRKAWEDASAVKHVAGMIHNAPLLQTLGISEWEDASAVKHVGDMEEEAVGILSQALINSSSLRKLSLLYVKWGEALLLNALARDDGNRSIERLWLANMDGLGGCLRKLLTSNPSLKEVTLDNLRMSPEEWHQLGEVIRDNAIATTITVKFSLDPDDGNDSIEALASAASSDLKDPIVELDLMTASEHQLMLSMNLLGRVLRGEVKSLESYHLHVRDMSTSGTNEDRMESILSMNGKTGETSVLKRLRLHLWDIKFWQYLRKGVWKDLLLCIRGNTSLTHFELDLSRLPLDEEAFRDVMGLLQVNLTLQEINVSRTTWAWDGKAALIQEALKQNQKRAVYMSVFRKARLTFGDAKAGRLFLCGSPLAGKTQLSQTLVHGKNWFQQKWAKFKRRTQGIEVEFLQNNDKDKFYDFCDPILREFLPSSSASTVDHLEIKKSIVSYLNDVGSIVSIPNLDYIIVDPNWLTNKLLGELVALGQNFQAQEHKRTLLDSYSSKDGFVNESVFARLIEKFLGKQPHGQRGVNRDMLENILINLDLCFKVEDTSQYFIPSFIPEHASTEVQKPQELAHVESMAWDSRVETSKFVGIRIQCEDGKTMSLTAAFFPCFQMFMRRKLISEMHVSKKIVTCSRHYLRLFLDGHQIYLEQGTSRNYVDVLMLCSDHKSREVAIKYVMKHVVQELISFCASSKGCPGVSLVLGVIQTRCVEMLIPIHLRGSILIEELKLNFIRDINDKLEDTQSDRFHLVKEEELFSHEHPWPLIKGHITEVIFERARELLWKSDVEAIVNEIRQKRVQQLESVQQGLMQQLESVHQGLIEVNNDLNHSSPENDNMVTNSNVPDVRDSNLPSSSCISPMSTSVESHETRLVLERIDRVGKKVDGVDERLRSMQSILQRLEMQILSLQQELQSTLSEFMSKVDRIIEYSQEFRQTRTPKRPYITDDVNILYKFSARLHLGTTVRLHLMCESATGVHMVEDQEGLKIRVDQFNKKWIAKTIEIFYKILYYVAKGAVGKYFPLGQVVPDFADLKSDIVKLDGISDKDRRAILKAGNSDLRAILKAGGSEELKQTWLRIQKTLGVINYEKIFKLYQVKYKRVELGGHAWVCEECMDTGLETGSLSRN